MSLEDIVEIMGCRICSICKSLPIKERMLFLNYYAITYFIKRSKWAGNNDEDIYALVEAGNEAIRFYKDLESRRHNYSS